MRALFHTIAVATLFLSSTTRGHDTWLLPRVFWAAPLDEPTVDLTSGTAFPAAEHAIDHGHIARAELHLAGEMTKIGAFEPAEKALILKLPKVRAGVATLWVALQSKTLELTDEKVAEYLDEIAAPDDVRAAWTRQKGKAPWRETYTKYAKSFIRVGEPAGDTSWQTPIGAGFEIVPVSDPSAYREGQQATFRVLLDGKPVGGQSVALIAEGSPQRVFQKTDAEGRVAFKFERAGRVLLSAVRLRQADGEDAWASEFTTLTMQVVLPPSLGKLDGTTTIGTESKLGQTYFNVATDTYDISGPGANMWGDRDECHFAWRKASFNDQSLAATIRFLTDEGHPHRKACLMLRQTLDADSPYVDVAVHGDGLISLQYRETKGGPTREVQANVKGVERLQLQRSGDYAYLHGGRDGDDRLRFLGPSTRIKLKPPFYVGMAVCAHEEGNLAHARAQFKGVSFTRWFNFGSVLPRVVIESMSADGTNRRVVHSSTMHYEAPNWTPDGKALILNSGGKLWRVDLGDAKLHRINTGFATKCNNDHGVSPDGTKLVISDQSQGDGKSRIYTLPIEGGTPKLITPKGPSYWHGWSPDGSTLVYCAERDGEFDVYRIPAEGGEEKRLTTAKGLDDGPEYSHDGKYIYFNSVRSGLMQIWRMDADGANQTQITNDEYNNWFPHPSPDGKYLVFLSYERGVVGHPEDKDVTLRRLTLAEGTIDVLARFRGGQGTINVPCWSRDSKKIAFVTYPAPPGGAD